MQEDAQLIAESLKGDENALSSLYLKHIPAVFNFIKKIAPPGIDADDIVQEAFIKAWRNLKKFDTSKSFKNWIFTIARNTLIDAMKKNMRQVGAYLDDEGAMEDADAIDGMPLPDELAERSELKDDLEKALDELTPPQKSVVILHAVEGMTFNEIAEIVEQPMDTVKTRYRRALAKLSSIIRKNPLSEPK